MNTWCESFSIWLANLYLSSTLFLVVAVVAMHATKQPARRLVIAWIGMFSLVCLAAIPIVPTWPRLPIGTYLDIRGRTSPDQGLGKAGFPDFPEGHDLTPPPRRIGEPPERAWSNKATPGSHRHMTQSDASSRQLSWSRIAVWTTRLSFAGYLLVGGWLCWGEVHVHRLCHRATKAPEFLRDFLSEVAETEHLPRVLVSSDISSPLAFGIANPTIVMPSRFLENEHEDVLKVALSHELAHIRNRDLWLLGVSRVLLLLLFAHPLYWLLRRKVRDDQDILADAAVATYTDRTEYAEMLLTWACGSSTRTSLVPVSAIGMWQRHSQLTTRITLLLREDYCVETSVSRGWRARAISALSLAMLILSVLTPWPPIRAMASFAPAGNGFSVDDNSLLKQQLLAQESRGELAGAVFDEAGIPLAGVLVDSCTWAEGNETFTDAMGRFRLDDLEPRQTCQVRFSKAGFSPQMFLVKQVGDIEWTVTLDRKTYFEGQISTADGRPAPDVLVRANQGPKRAQGITIRNIWTETRTDEEGRYRLYVQPDTYELHARKRGLGIAKHDQRFAIAHGQTTRLDMQLQPGVPFRAHFVDSQTGEPVSGVLLWAWQHRDIRGTSDVDGLVNIGDVPPGVYRFHIEARQHARWWIDLNVRALPRQEHSKKGRQGSFNPIYMDLQQTMPTVTIILERCVQINGIVVNPERRPVAGATVSPARTGTGNSITGDTRFSVLSAADGSFQLNLPASGDARYNLVAHDGRSSPLRRWSNGVSKPFQAKPGDTIEKLKLQLTRPGAVEGRVVDQQGQPVAGHKVRAHAADKNENRYYDPTTTTDAVGKFQLSLVRPGSQFVQASPFWGQAERAPEGTSQTVTVSPGETLRNIVLRVE